MSGEEARDIVEAAVRRELFGPSEREERAGQPLDTSDGTVRFESVEASRGRFHDAATGEEILTRSDPLRRYGIGVLHGRPGPRQRTDVESQDEIDAEADPSWNSDLAASGGNLNAPEINTSEGHIQKYDASRDDYADDLDLTDAHKSKPSAMAISIKCRLPEKASLEVRVKGAYYDPIDVLIYDQDKPRKWWIRRPFELTGKIDAGMVRNMGDMNSTKSRRKRCNVPMQPSAKVPGSFSLPSVTVYSQPILRRSKPSRKSGGMPQIRVHDLAEQLDLSSEETLDGCQRLGISANTKNSRIPENYADKVRRNFGSHLVTIVVINDNHKLGSGSALFQMGFTVHARDGSVIDPYPEVQLPSPDEEQQSIALLYRNKRTYAIGHGCAADWREPSAGDAVTCVEAVALPAHDVDIPSPEIYVTDNEGNRKQLKVSMMALADNSAEGREQVETVLAKYEEWIEGREREIDGLPERFHEAAKRHMADCRHALQRMQTGWNLVRSDRVALRAFKLANRAMFHQQWRSRLPLREMKRGDDGLFAPVGPHPRLRVAPNQGQWRPFQIAFILATLPELVYPEQEHRSLVDLIFFPTGGGKTEAYLGASAVSLLARRLRNPDDSGTDTIMRYTLRLLTAQQFQRAASLVCALEDIRSRYTNELGGSPFGIGLWVGRDNTPNSWEEACGKLSKLGNDARVGNKFVLLRCPWCGAQMGPLGSGSRQGKGQEVIGYEADGDRVVFRCADSKCRFGGRETLPIHVVDEDIYEVRPSIVIGTVDKFANLAWKPEARGLFGLGADGDRDVSPPGLIIQDEMHAISGPLGSIFGIYEPVVEELCTDRRPERTRAQAIAPKIIAATATVRRYGEQITGLFGRDQVALFPPHGLEEGDSFFARRSTDSEEGFLPRKRYLGLMSASLRSTQEVQVRVAATTLQAAVALPADDRDGYWTNLNFLNSLRHLGNTRSFLESDVREYLNGLQLRDKVDTRRLRRIKELTSRLRSDEIPQAIEELKEEYQVDAGYDQPACLDICLASNIVELGVDVDRLGLMTIVGQPKTTSQYIQVSGRVGRKDVPGLVLTIYRSSNPRDRSHFERFRTYHQALYSQVEPTSVTPFATPVLRRALHAAIISYIRQIISSEKKPDPFPKTEYDHAVAFLRDRAEIVDSEEVSRLLRWVQLREKEWSGVKHLEWEVEKGPDGNIRPGLMRYPGNFPALGRSAVLWDVPRSMRNVDAECRLEIRDSRQDRLNNRSKSNFPAGEGGVEGRIRRAHLITPSGIGAMSTMVDGTSLITAGLDHWYDVKDNKKTLRLEEYESHDWRLESRLGVKRFYLPPDHRTSSVASKDDGDINIALTVPALRFPRWHYCVYCKRLWPSMMSDPRPVECPDEKHAEWTNGPTMSQVQWVVMCRDGHLDDFPFKEWVHRSRRPECSGTVLRLISRGGGSPERQSIKCDECGAKRSLYGITETLGDPDTNGHESTHLTDKLTDVSHERYLCTGKKPQLNGPKDSCSLPVRASQRSASNVYFPLVESSLLLPREKADRSARLRDLCRMPDATKAMSVLDDILGTDASIEQLRRNLPVSFNEIDDKELMEAYHGRVWEGSDEQTSVEEGTTDFLTSIDEWRYPEYRCLLDCPEGEDLSATDQEIDFKLASKLSRVLSVDALTETRALRGFTRVQYQELNVRDGKAMLRRKLLPHDQDWLPAYVVKGEGIYLGLGISRLAEWEKRPKVQARANAMKRNWSRAGRGKSPPRMSREISARFVLVHTLGHLLINELVFTCGYSSASLRERLYVSEASGSEMAGLLIYTAAGDSDGTMGGLVRMARPKNLKAVFESALARARWCSTDPVCMDVGKKGQGPDSCNLAACHGCALVPETSCEEFNRFLDRGLVVGTLADSDIGFFSDFLDRSGS